MTFWCVSSMAAKPRSHVAFGEETVNNLSKHNLIFAIYIIICDFTFGEISTVNVARCSGSCKISERSHARVLNDLQTRC